MKKLILSALFLAVFSIAYGQKDPIDSYIIPQERYLEFEGAIKSIMLLNYTLKENIESKQDTSYFNLSRTYFSENKIPINRLYFNSPGDTMHSQKLTFDSLGRKAKLDSYDEDYKPSRSIIQHFTAENKYPDSIVIAFKQYGFTEKWYNWFEDNRVVRQEFYTSDTLRHFFKYKYDDKGRLTEQIKINTPNGFGITLDKSITGTVDETTLYPNDTTTFEYEEIGDTLKTFKYNNSKLRELSEKTRGDGMEFVSTLNFNRGGVLTSIHNTRKFGDSINEIWYGLYKGDTTSITKQIRTPDIIRYSYNRLKRDDSRESITIIERTLDNFGNWILQKNIRKEEITVIERILEYYGH